MSERRLTRLLLDHMGQTPGRHVRQVRLEAAANLLVATTLTVAIVAALRLRRAAETRRQAFTQRYGISPARYRATQTNRLS